MKYFALTLFVFFIVLGCQSETKTPKEQVPKVLDWNKAASEQNLKIGDTITVEGIAYNIYPYNYHERLIVHETVISVAALQVESIPPEASIPVYNPNQPDVESNPDVPIGAVVCTIYNLMLNKDVQKMQVYLYPFRVPLESRKEALSHDRLAKIQNRVRPPYNSYSGLSLSKHLIVQHKFQVTGTIQRFGRKVLRGVSLQCVDIEVSDLTITESKKVHEKLYDMLEK